MSTRPLRSASALLAFVTAAAAQDLAPTPDPDARLDDSLRARIALRDPAADAGWPAERSYPQVNAGLGELEVWLMAGAAHEPPIAAAPEAAVGRLRPALELAFESERFDVWRPAAEAGQANAVPAGDVIEAMRSFVAALVEVAGEEARLERAHFEIFDVRAEAGAVRTSAHARFGARGAEGSVEVRAIWHTRWTVGSEGALALAGLEASDYEEVRATGEPLFEDRTAELLGPGRLWREQLARGIDFWRARLDTRLGLPILAHPAGIAVGDADGDGLDDVFLCQPGGIPNRLLLHRTDGTILDASAPAGLDHLDFSRAALFVDFDADGDQDLAVVMGSDLVFLENDGRRRFREKVAHEVGNATSLAAADYDGDGDVDLYVCAYFVPYEDAGAGGALPTPYHDAKNGQRNVLFANDGDWSFRDVTGQVGLEAGNSRFSFAASWEDFDNDGDQDLYVANDFGANNLYRNDRGVFADVAAQAGVQDVAAGMGVSWADANGDGWMDLYVSNMFSFAGNRMTGQAEFMPGSTDDLRNAYRRHARGNSLFLNRGDGTFTEAAEEQGVAHGRWAWGAVWLDLDNSGTPDLVVPNGFLTAGRDDEL